MGILAPYSSPSGTSIIAVCLILTYWVGHYALKAFRIPKNRDTVTTFKFSEYNLIALGGIFFVTWFYVVGNGAVRFLSPGFIFYLVISYFLLQKRAKYTTLP